MARGEFDRGGKGEVRKVCPQLWSKVDIRNRLRSGSELRSIDEEGGEGGGVGDEVVRGVRGSVCAALRFD